MPLQFPIPMQQGPADGQDPLAFLRQALMAQGIEVPEPDLSPTSGIPSDWSPFGLSGGTGAFGAEVEDGPIQAMMTGQGEAAGATMDRVAAGGNALDEDEGMPPQRLEQMHQAWLAVKQPELLMQLGWEKYYHGKQWTESELQKMAIRGQPPTYFNELAKKVNSYIGIEQRMRRDPKASPRTPSHEGDCDACTAALREIHDETRSAILYSESGRDFWVRGIAAVFGGAERKRNGEIRIVKRRIPAMNFIYDPRSLEWDFSDAKFLGEWGWYDLEDAEELMLKLGRPDSAEMMSQLIGLTTSAQGGSVPGEWARMKADWYSQELGRIRLVHLYYRFKGEWRCAYFCGQIKLFDEVSRYEDEDGDTICPIRAASCNVDEEGTRYGIVKDLIPIQDSINQRHSKLLWMLSVRQIIVEKGAVDDVNVAREQAKRPDGVIVLNPRGKGGEIDRTFRIQSLDSQIEGHVKLLDSSIMQMQNYGPNPAMLGKEEGVDQSGRAILAKQNAGMTEIAPGFDRHREFKLVNYKRDWLLVRQFWTYARWVAVMDDGPMGAQKAQKFIGLNQPKTDPQTGQTTIENDVSRMEVNLIIEEGPDTITMQEELGQQLSQLGPNAASPTGKVLIQLSGVRNKDYLMGLLDEQNKPDPKQQEFQQRLQLLEELIKAAELDKKIAETGKINSEAAVNLMDAAATPELLAQFPLEWGARSFVEQQLDGQPLNQLSMMNAFYDAVIGPTSPGLSSPPGGPPPTAPDGTGGPPAQPGRGQPGGAPGHMPAFDPDNGPQTPDPMHGELHVGGPGGIPLPSNQSPGLPNPPPNARP